MFRTGEHTLCPLRCRDHTEGEERSETVLPADDGQQMPLGGADHPDGGLLGRGPCREARLWPHQDLRCQTQQVSPTRRKFSLPSLTLPVLKESLH